MDWYLRKGGVSTLERLTAFEFKRYLTELQGRGLKPNTVHGCFETLHAFANWAARENYPVDPALLRARAPKVPQQEMETYSAAQIQALLQAAPEGWPRMAGIAGCVSQPREWQELASEGLVVRDRVAGARSIERFTPGFEGGLG